MPPILATVICSVFIIGLFVCDRDSRERTSPSLWIPGLWLGIIASRPVSAWLNDLGIYSSGLRFDSPDTYLDGSPIDRIVFAALIVSAIVVLAGRARNVYDLLSNNIPLVMLLLYCGASTLWAEYTLVGIKRWIKCLGDIAMISVILTDPDKNAAIRQIFVRCGFVLLPLSALFIKFYPDLGRTYHIWTWTYMFTGVTQGKNMLGATCLVLGISSLWCFIKACCAKREARRANRIVVHGTVVAMVVWLFLLANSMTSLACFVLVGMMVGCLQMAKNVRSGIIVHLLSLITIGLPFASLFLGLGNGSFGSIGRNATLTGRTGIWQLVIQMTDNPVFGAGFESFWMGKRLAVMWTINDGFFKGIQSAHNGYLEVFANLGWVGVAFLFIMVLSGYRRATLVFRVNPNCHIITLAYIITALIYNFTEAGFRMMTPVWFAFVLAIMHSTMQPSVRHERPIDESGPAFSRRRGMYNTGLQAFPWQARQGALRRGTSEGYRR